MFRNLQNNVVFDFLCVMGLTRVGNTLRGLKKIIFWKLFLEVFAIKTFLNKKNSKKLNKDFQNDIDCVLRDFFLKNCVEEFFWKKVCIGIFEICFGSGFLKKSVFRDFWKKKICCIWSSLNRTRSKHLTVAPFDNRKWSSVIDMYWFFSYLNFRIYLVVVHTSRRWR